MAELVRVAPVWGLCFSPEGQRVAHVSMRDGRYNLWVVPVAEGEPEQLTFFDTEVVREVHWSAASGRILFSASGGDGNARLYVLDPGTGRPPREIDAGGASGRSNIHWAPGGREAFFAAPSRSDPERTEIVECGVEGGERRALASLPGEVVLFPPSPDGRLLPVLEILAYARPEGVLHLLDRRTGSMSTIGDRKDPAQLHPCGWTGDGRLHLRTDASSEFLRIERLEPGRREREVVVEASWDVSAAALAADGKRLAYVVNEGGRGRLRIRDLGTSEERLLSGDAHEPLVFSPDGRRLLFGTMTARESEQYWIEDLARGGRSHLLGTLPPGIDPADLVEPAPTSFPGKGGEVPALYYRPRGKGPFPCVLEIHGGPFFQEVPRFFWLHQFLLQAGIAVFAPNIRGSSGYGKAYARALRGNWGGPDLEDVEAAVRHLKGHREIDPARIALHGTSYGGYAALLAYARLPEAWKAVAVGCGPANLSTHFAALPPAWRRSVEADWGPLDDPSVQRKLRERSPLSDLDRAKAPLFIWQGAKDPIVSPAEADQVVASLRKRGIPVEHLLFPEAGHGFTRTEDRLRACEAVSAFLMRHLL